MPDIGLTIHFNYMVGDSQTAVISDDSNLNGIFKNFANTNAGLMRTSDVRWDKEPNNWVSYSEVQFEQSDTATEFERLTYAEQLAMCHRYFFKTTQRIHATIHSASQSMEYYKEFYYPTTMRVTPSIKFGSIHAGNITIHSDYPNNNQNGFLVYSTNGFAYVDGFEADAEI